MSSVLVSFISLLESARSVSHLRLVNFHSGFNSVLFVLKVEVNLNTTQHMVFIYSYGD